MDGSRWNKAGNCIRTSLWKAIRSILHLCTAPIWPSWVLDFDLQSWPPPPSWLMDRPTAYPSSRAGPVMNEYVLYQPCITSWSIVLFHPTNLSFSQRLINYELGSVSNYDLIANQSEPTTPPIYAGGEPGWGFFFGPVHVPVGYNCIRYLQALFLVLAWGSWESFLPRYQHHSGEGSIGRLWEAKKQSSYCVEFSNECLVCPQGSIFRFCHWCLRQ